MNDYATFQCHDKRHSDFPPAFIAHIDAMHGHIAIILFFVINV
jgi:hypothetical protein